MNPVIRQIVKVCFFLLLVIPLALLAPDVAFANPLTAENFSAHYQEVAQKVNALLSEKSKLKSSGRHQNSRHFLRDKNRLTPSQRHLKEEKKYLETIAELRDALIAIYAERTKKNFPLQQLNMESTRLAIGLVNETKRLREQYKSFAIPIVHNMLIDVGIKKRGACKHWAEDLLEYLKPIKRDFFYVTWGEANPKKMNEHNVAVLYPNFSNFYEGLIIDPWRTAGKPFWIRVTDDKHYKWNPWNYYGVY